MSEPNPTLCQLCHQALGHDEAKVRDCHAWCKTSEQDAAAELKAKQPEE